MTEHPALRISCLGLIRHGRPLVQLLDLVLPPGGRLAVLGHPGSGKSVLLETIAGGSEPEVGTIATAQPRVPCVFQQPRLLDWLSVQRNVEFFLPAAQRPQVAEWLHALGLAHCADACPLQLSGGMRQRVAIAQALACRPPLLLIDSPFDHLADSSAAALRAGLLTHLRTTGTAALWATRDPAEAVHVAERTLILHGSADGAWSLIDHAEHRDPAAVLAAALPAPLPA